MKIFVTGVGGQLGYDVAKRLKSMGIETVSSDVYDSPTVDTGTDYIKMDITDAESVHEIITNVRPDAVIHCAAYTAVDAAENEENAPTVNAVNVVGTENIARACKKIGCKMMYISTDYVFDGKGTNAWQPDSSDFSPLNNYGASKFAGERTVVKNLDNFFIVRISWVFGINGKNFVKTMLSLGKKLGELRVVNDQIGTPTYTYDLALLISEMIVSEKYGFYHATNEGGYISWYDFAVAIFDIASEYDPSYKDVRVIPVSTEEYGVSKAKRPLNCRLDKSKLSEQGFHTLPDWKDALRRYIIDLGL